MSLRQTEQKQGTKCDLLETLMLDVNLLLTNEDITDKTKLDSIKMLHIKALDELNELKVLAKKAVLYQQTHRTEDIDVEAWTKRLAEDIAGATD